MESSFTLCKCSKYPVILVLVARGSSDKSLFLPSSHLIPSPYALRNPGLVDVVHRDRGGSRVAPRKLAVAAGWRNASQLLDAVGGLPRGRGGFARAMSVSPRTTVTPLILYPIALQLARMCRKGFNPTKKKTKRQFKIKYYCSSFENILPAVCGCALQ